MEEKRGYIKLWRSFIDTSLFKKGTHIELKLYILLILKAHWSDYKENLYGKTITLHSGEILTTINELVEDLGKDSSPMKVRYALAKLEEKGEIKITPMKKRTIISIQNWKDKYAANSALATGLATGVATGLTTSPSMGKPMKSSKATDGDKSFSNRSDNKCNNKCNNDLHDYNKYYSLLQEDIQEDIQEDSANKEIYNDSANKDYIGEKQQQKKSPPKKKRTVFVKPTLEEVKAYIKEKGYTFDPEAFMDYYEANGWKVGKNQMKSWKATCNNWERNQNRFKKNESEQIAVGRFGADYHLNL